MLRPEEFSVGAVRDAAAEGLTLLLPRTEYEQPMLIAAASGAKIAVFLGAEHAFHALDEEINGRFEGILIPSVRIELDPASIFDPSGSQGLPAGTLIREEDTLKIAAFMREGRHGFERLQRVPLLIGLPPGPEREAAAFRRWQIVLGEGDDRKILRELSVALPVAGA
jgi:hypothetical protein